MANKIRSNGFLTTADAFTSFDYPLHGIGQWLQIFFLKSGDAQVNFHEVSSTFGRIRSPRDFEVLQFQIPAGSSYNAKIVFMTGVSWVIKFITPQ